jgi:hypothetical protein
MLSLQAWVIKVTFAGAGLGNAIAGAGSGV